MLSNTCTGAYLGIVFNRLARHDEAARMYRKAWTLSGNGNIGYCAGIGWSEALEGDTATARQTYDELIAKAKRGDWVPG